MLGAGIEGLEVLPIRVGPPERRLCLKRCWSRESPDRFL